MQPTKIENWVQESIDNRSVAAQKDFRHAVHIILKAISLSENLSKSMIFKGGMLLGIKYQSERYTTDLDFSTAEKLDPNCIQGFTEEFNDKRPLHKPATYSRHQSQTQLKTGIGVKR